MKRTSMLALAGATAMSLSTAALAHVTLEAKSAKLGSGYKAVFSVPHGCEGSETTAVQIDVPEGVIAVKPMPKAGWTLALEKGPYSRSYAFYHGETKSEGVKKVTWTGGPLPDDYFDQFVLSTFIAAELAPGAITFPVTQKCAKGELHWNEVAAAGQDSHALKYPAPVLQLVAGDGDDHHHHHAAAAPAGIDVSGAWTRPASAGGMGVGYGKITNGGAEADTLLGATSDIAERVELHETTIDDQGVARMKPVGEVELAPGKSVELKPGGMHLMLIGLKEPIEEGSPVKAKLNFKKAGSVDVEFAVKTSPPGASGDHEHMHHHH